MKNAHIFSHFKHNLLMNMFTKVQDYLIYQKVMNVLQSLLNLKYMRIIHMRRIKV